jgi:hypothetical protein
MGVKLGFPTLVEEHRPIIFENKIPTKIFSPLREYIWRMKEIT